MTHYAKGSAAPRGRVSLPHDPRTSEERILVFADGKHAEAAKKMGVAYVGGEELVNDVSVHDLPIFWSLTVTLAFGSLLYLDPSREDPTYQSPLHPLPPSPYKRQTCAFPWSQGPHARRPTRDGD